MTNSAAVARVGCALLLLAFTLAGCPCKKGPEPEPTPPFPHLEEAQEDIVAAIGGTVETWPEDQPELIYSVVFPPGSLSSDATVIVTSPDNEPPNPCEARLEQASSFLTIDTGTASIVGTIFVHIPYSDYSGANPPMPIMFDAGGTLLDVLVPSFSSGEVTVDVRPRSGRLGWSLGLYDYVDPVTLSHLDIAQGSSFNFQSDAPAVLLIHGCGGTSNVFKEGPEPTLYDFLSDAYGGRVWTWGYESVVESADSTGAALVRAVERLEDEHGAFPFKIDIVAHSMGGLEARYLVRNGDASVVRTVVFLGTPNNGTTKAAWFWHVRWLPSFPGADEWLNPSGLGVEDLLVGSSFLARLNTPLTLGPGADVDYYMIAGDYTPDNPYAPGSDDHFISTQSVDLHNVPHESATLHDQWGVIGLMHGQLKENHGAVFSLIGEALGLGTIIVDPNPDGLNAPWHLEGPGGYTRDGTGDGTLPGRAPGSYTITCGAVAGYVTPSPQTQTLAAGGTITFSCDYIGGAIIYVDCNGGGDYDSIGAAMEAASYGTTILVSPGEYVGDIVFKDGVKVVSSGGPLATTIIASGDNDAIVQFTNVGSSAELRGFSITGTLSPYAIVCDSAAPIIRGNVISCGWVSAIWCDASPATISGNLIHDCGYKGITCAWRSDAIIEQNTIYHNGYTTAGPSKCGIDADILSRPRLERNIIAKNAGRGIYRYQWSSGYPIVMVENDVWGNLGGNYYNVSDQTGLNGNISEDPLLCGPDNADFSLGSQSPCVLGDGQMGAYGVGCE